MEMHNFTMYDACNLDVNDDHLIWYDWVADTATTSHITHQREAFIDYTPLNNALVTEVGGWTAKIAGQGMVLLTSIFNRKNYTLCLEDVIHVTEQTNNLISLRRWDKRGGTYIGGKGKITLCINNRIQVAWGKQVANNLYKMAVHLPNQVSQITCTVSGHG